MKILQVAKNYKIIIFCLLNFFSIFTLLTVSATPEDVLNFNLIRNNFLENVQIIKSIQLSIMKNSNYY